MPSVSKSQQRLMGMVHAMQKGKLQTRGMNPSLRSKVKKVSDSIKQKDAEKFARTRHKGLPDRVSESVDPVEDIFHKLASSWTGPDHTIDEQDVDRIKQDIAQKLNDGWLPVEILRLLSYTEEVNPTIPEDKALSRMAAISRAVKARLAGTHEEQAEENTRTGGAKQAYSLGHKHGLNRSRKINAHNSFGPYADEYESGYRDGASTDDHNEWREKRREARQGRHYHEGHKPTFIDFLMEMTKKEQEELTAPVAVQKLYAEIKKKYGIVKRDVFLNKAAEVFKLTPEGLKHLTQKPFMRYLPFDDQQAPTVVARDPWAHVSQKAERREQQARQHQQQRLPAQQQPRRDINWR